MVGLNLEDILYNIKFLLSFLSWWLSDGCLQLRHLRDQAVELEAQLHGMQHDIVCEEQDLNVLKTRLQQMNPGDSQYVRQHARVSVAI